MVDKFNYIKSKHFCSSNTNLTLNTNTYTAWNQAKFTLQNIIFRIARKWPKHLPCVIHLPSALINLLNPQNNPKTQLTLVASILQVREWRHKGVLYLVQGASSDREGLELKQSVSRVCALTLQPITPPPPPHPVPNSSNPWTAIQ